MNRQATRAAVRATKQAGGDPAVAAELDQLRRVRAGTYALIHVLMSRIIEAGIRDPGEKLHIPRGEWQALPPNEKLRISIDPETADATLWIEPA